MYYSIIHSISIGSYSIECIKIYSNSCFQICIITSYCKRRERQNCFNWIEENNVFGVYGEDTLKETRECFNEREVINIHAETYVLEIELKDEC